MGFASAMAWLVFLIILMITAIQINVIKRWVYYEVRHFVEGISTTGNK